MLVVLAAVALVAFFHAKNSKAEDDVEEKIEELEKKADVYKEIIEIKQKQQQTLSNQIEIIEAEAGKLDTEIKVKKAEIKNINEQILRIKGAIEEKQKTIESQKKILIELLQSYYANKQDYFVLNLLGSAKYPSFMFKESGLAQTKNKVEEIINSVKSMKEALEKERDILEKKKEDVLDLSFKLEEKVSLLESNQEQKELLFRKTQGEEGKYQKLLAKIEEQKLELLQIDELSTSMGLSADAYEKPPKDSYASTDWYYSQKDSRWANENIGNSKSLMKDWGCAVTSVAMVSTYHGGKITPKSLADKSIYSWDLINWDFNGSWKDAKIDLTSSSNHGNISWGAVDSELKKENPVIAYIKKTNGGGGHYVVIHNKTSKGKYVVHDPYFGSNIYLDTSRALVGKVGKDSGTVIDQMIIYHKK